MRSKCGSRPVWQLLLPFLVAGVLFLQACQGSSPAASQVAGQVSSTPSSATSDLTSAPGAQWDAVVAAAKQEGNVALYGPPGGPYQDALISPFEQAYPEVHVTASMGDANEEYAKLVAERSAGQFLADVWVSGTTPSSTDMKAAGISAPLQPALVLPEVADPNAWLDGHFWWADSDEPRTNLMFQGGVNNVVFYNTNTVDPNQFTSYYDLLDPKWRGKIVATDIRRPGPGGVPSRFMYANPDLGPDFLGRLFADTDAALSSDQRQMVDWVAQGRYDIGLFLSDTDVATAMDQGLPIAPIPAARFKEGASIGPGYGAVSLVQGAPHPNAATLYVNWLLSKEGQVVWQKDTFTPSLRVDIPKDGVPATQVPQPGVTYVNAGTDKYSVLTSSAIGNVITEALAKVGRN